MLGLQERIIIIVDVRVPYVLVYNANTSTRAIFILFVILLFSGRVDGQKGGQVDGRTDGPTTGRTLQER